MGRMWYSDDERDQQDRAVLYRAIEDLRAELARRDKTITDIADAITAADEEAA